MNVSKSIYTSLDEREIIPEILDNLKLVKAEVPEVENGERKPIFRYISALAGAGKTYHSTREAAKLASNGDCIIFCNPSKKLNEQTKNELNSLKEFDHSYTVECIDSDNPDNFGIVGKKILTVLEKGPILGNYILIMTHEAFRNISYFPQKNKWKVFVDEAQDVTVHIDVPFDLDDKFIHIEPYLSYNKSDEFAKATIIENPDGYTSVRDRFYSDGMLSKAMRSIFQEIINTADGKCDMYIHKAFLHSQRIVISTIYNPTLYTGTAGIRFSSAIFEQTLQYQYWSKYITWTEDKAVKLRFSQHSKPIEIYYGFKDANQSNSFLNNKVEGITLLDHFRKAELEKRFELEITDAPVLVMANKKTDIVEDEKYIRCVHNAQGLREYNHINTLLYEGSFNRSPPYYHWLEFMKLCYVENSLHLYQTLLRTSYREPENNETVRLFVPCVRLFTPLKELFPNARLISLEIDHLKEKIIDRRKNVYKLSDGCYENKPADLKKIGFGGNSVRNKKKINDTFIESGYVLKQVPIIDKYKHKVTKELWVAAAHLNNLHDYCSERGWKIAKIAA